MKKLYILSLILCFGTAIWAQQPGFNYATEKREPIPLAGTANFSNLGPDFYPEIRYLAPIPGGEAYQTFLMQQKSASAERFPRQKDLVPQRGGGAEPPLVLNEFAGNNSTASTPQDNHCAVSNDGQIVSVINRHVAIKDPTGSWLGAATLNNFISDLNLSNDQFDPRVLYDPESDRFIMFMIHERTSSKSKIVIAFSQTNDAAGDWNLYTISGNPFGENTWSDYPIIAHTATEVFVTINLIVNNQSWQDGFTQSLIWQIDKADGYNGDPLDTRLWSDINFDGVPIRNLCPVKKGDGLPDDRLFLLSNRNFDVENDSIFIFELTGTMDDPDTELLIDVQKADVPYGVAPDALQSVGTLATNDARVLDAIYQDDIIQFVGNSVDPNTGQAAIYHGIIDEVSGARTISGYVVNGGLDDIGYPSIAYTGVEPGDQDAIIVVSHSSPIRFPGCSGIYFNNDRMHSPLVTIKEGNNFINMIGTQDQERWGDYSGNQRKYDEPGVVWISSSFGESNNDNDTWIGELARPDLFVATQPEPVGEPRFDVFPNPAADRVEVRFEVPAKTANVRICLIDALGRNVKELIDRKPKYDGLLSFSFSVEPLPAGLYYLQVQADDQLVLTKPIVVE
ncbi:MAG: T9SS type A sorting domain-containing protein [Saprospiraceae bacterium]|nr:T9SS type A sorting domain-containing protein [Saprospiraceae bacterium]